MCFFILLKEDSWFDAVLTSVSRKFQRYTLVHHHSKAAAWHKILSFSIIVVGLPLNRSMHVFVIKTLSEAEYLASS